ncbi:MAG: patatin-like phospholipase family protein [Bacteroidales bacterium]
MTKSLRKTVQASCFAVIALFLLCGSTPAQEVAGRRPRVGIALSGGGSHGIAHIGVLKVMEEAGLYPDLITGVSMGSVIGSHYALGYSLDSLQKALKSIDWNTMLSDKIPENKVIFQEKRYFFNSLITLPLGGGSITLPAALINGQQIDNMLNYYLWPAADINDFSKLPLPFLCLGTDILSANKVVLSQGYLPKAVRGSMAIPSVFAPVWIDQKLIVDGGVVRNISVSELKDMGADIIIGSYVGFHPSTEESIESVTNILKQVAMLTSHSDYVSEKKNIHILIEPGVKDLSSFAFDNVDTLVARGYRAALPFKEDFARIADSLNRYGTRPQPENLLMKQTYTFDNIIVEGNVRTPADKILGILDLEPGEMVTKEKLAESIELLYGKALFDKITYRIEPEDESLTLVIECIEKAPNMLYASLHYDNALSSGMLLSVVLRNILSTGMSVYLDTYLGQYNKFNFSALQFLDRNEKFAIGANLNAETTRMLHVTINDETGTMTGKDIITGLSLQKRIGLNHMMSLEGDIKSMSISTDYISPSNLRRLKYNYLSLAYNYQVNTLDNKHYPRSGTTLNFSGGVSKLYSGIIRTDTSRVVISSEDVSDFSFERFLTLHGEVRSYFSPDPKLTLCLKGTALFISETNPAIAGNNFFLLGGIEKVSRRSIPVTGFHALQIPVKRAAGAGIDANITLLKDLYLTCHSDFFIIQEPGNSNDLSALGGYGIGLGYMSIAGPIKVGVMHGIYNKEFFYPPVKGYLSIGFRF